MKLKKLLNLLQIEEIPSEGGLIVKPRKGCTRIFGFWTGPTGTAPAFCAGLMLWVSLRGSARPKDFDEIRTLTPRCRTQHMKVSSLIAVGVNPLG
uniref:Uncharacterized protein n=1 Tax=Tetranychus urticae TaxID=32264 RepID=T1KNV2_TETUR